MMKFSKKVRKGLDAAIKIAEYYQYGYVTPEHLLYAILDEQKQVQKWISDVGGDANGLKLVLRMRFTGAIDGILGFSGKLPYFERQPPFSRSLKELLKQAKQTSKKLGKNKIMLKPLLISFFDFDEEDENELSVSNWLENVGFVEKDKFIQRVLPHVSALDESAPDDDNNDKNATQSSNDKLLHLPEHLKNCIFGQDEVIDLLFTLIKRAEAGLRNEEKPIASLLFVGTTGVGKTELVRQLAKYLEMPLLRFDMSEYQDRWEVSKLFGTSAGYIGYDDGGVLTNAVMRQPESVVLLDEIEKAHKNIFNVLLQIMDYGTLTDGHGRKVDFRKVIFIMTSNAGAHDANSVIGMGSQKSRDRISSMMSAVKNIFTPEFRNRLDAIVPFNCLTEEQVKRIVSLQIDNFKSSLKEKGFELEMTPACYDSIAKKGFSEEFGAREVTRVIECEIKDKLADVILFEKKGHVKSVFCDVDENSNIQVTIS